MYTNSLDFKNNKLKSSLELINSRNHEFVSGNYKINFLFLKFIVPFTISSTKLTLITIDAPKQDYPVVANIVNQNS